MGGILLIADQSSKEQREKHLLKMANVAAYRGEASCLHFDGLSLCLQSRNQDAVVYQTERLTLLLHGYLAEPRGVKDVQVGLAFLADGWSDDVVKPLRYLRGEFSLLIYEHCSRKLTILRSISGRPLFFSVNSSRLVIASEQRQVLASGVDTSGVNTRIVMEYMLFHRTLGEKTATVRNGIQRFLASHIYTVDLPDYQPRHRGKYWSICEQVSDPENSEAVLSERMRDQIGISVMQSLSERPGHLALSGGLDSGSIWAVLRRLTSSGNPLAARVQTASMVYPGLACDESVFLDEIDQQYGQWGFRLDLSSAEAGEGVDNVLASAPDFLIDGSFYQSVRLMREISMCGSSVLYLGLGGDEWFSQTGDYLRSLLLRGKFSLAWNQLGSLELAARSQFMLRSLVAGVLGHSTVWRKIRRRRYFPFLGEQALPLLHEAYDEEDMLKRRHGPKGFHDYVELLRWQSRGGEVVEQACAVNGLEPRFPLMNNELIRFCHHLPAELRYRPGSDKLLVRKAMRGLLPDVILARKHKTTFDSPLVNSPGLLEDLPRLRCWRTVEDGFISLGFLRKQRDEGLKRNYLPSWLVRAAWAEHHIRKLGG